MAEEVAFIPLEVAIPLASSWFDAASRVLFHARQDTIGEAVLADAWDITIGLVPFIGDVVGNGQRVSNATANNDRMAQILHGSDFIIDLVPVVGDVISALLPANTILKLQEASKCSGSNYSCLVKPDSFDDQVIGMLHVPVPQIVDRIPKPPKTPPVIDAIFEKL